MGFEAALANIASESRSKQALFAVCCPDEYRLDYWKRCLDYFVPEMVDKVFIFPNAQLLPYDRFAADPAVVSARLRTLSQLHTLESGVVLFSMTSTLPKMVPRTHIAAHSFELYINQKLSLSEFKETVLNLGYRLVQKVQEIGEFSVTGGVVELFPLGTQQAYRLDFLGNEIDGLYSMDPGSNAVKACQKVVCFPRHEYPVHPAALKAFNVRWTRRFNSAPPPEVELERLGAERYLPLFFDNMDSFFNYLPRHAKIVCDLRELEQLLIQHWDYILKRHAQQIQASLSPEELYWTPNEWLKALRSFQRTALDLQTKSVLPESLPTEDQQAMHNWANRMQRYPKIVFSAQSTGQLAIAMQWLSRCGKSYEQCDSWAQVVSSRSQWICAQTPIQTHCFLEKQKIWVIAIGDCLGHSVAKTQKAEMPSSNQLALQHWNELTTDCPVTHVEHGIGRYRGLTFLAVDGQSAEYLLVEYAEGEKIYVPIHQLHALTRYYGSEPAPWHSLSQQKTWKKQTEKALEHAQALAYELLEMRAQRLKLLGVQFHMDRPEYERFCAYFPHEETPDQKLAIEAVEKDLCSGRIMERLICADVGFGKTEVALRASFLAVYSQKQVIILVPTTLLVEQHYQTFTDRFSAWPVKVAALSRFQSEKQQQKILEDLARGQVDIVIGTHRLLSQDIQTKNLALLIIDEEHRFGVAQKERIKNWSKQVHLLLLSATPIPRTLNMALNQLADLSLIASPPQKRVPITTIVAEKSDILLQEAVEREWLRGGQIFLVHNRVQTIEMRRAALQGMFPHLRIALAHGQLAEEELEQTMLDFYNQRYDLLICTTIIETGIDIPSANTIVIEHPEKLGLAQLHQLRGRVGRRNRQAYAYCLYEDDSRLTTEARQRLIAFSKASTLGSGFKLALQDMEIRGAGQLLGRSQSGHAHLVGLNLYSEMVQSAVEQQEERKDQSFSKNTEVILKYPCFVPSDYCPDPLQRLSVYQALMQARSRHELFELQVAWIDALGPLPEPLKNLLLQQEIKLLGRKFDIEQVHIGLDEIRICFHTKPKIDSERFFQWLNSDRKSFHFLAPRTIKLQKPVSTVLQSLKLIEETLCAFMLV